MSSTHTMVPHESLRCSFHPVSYDSFLEILKTEIKALRWIGKLRLTVLDMDLGESVDLIPSRFAWQIKKHIETARTSNIDCC